MKNKFSLCISTIILLSLVASCTSSSSKYNQVNYQRIQVGMTLEEVIAILGPPTSSSSLSFGTNIVISSNWEESGTLIWIEFQDGKVKMKRIIQGSQKGQ